MSISRKFMITCFDILHALLSGTFYTGSMYSSQPHAGLYRCTLNSSIELQNHAGSSANEVS